MSRSEWLFGLFLFLVGLYILVMALLNFLPGGQTGGPLALGWR